MKKDKLETLGFLTLLAVLVFLFGYFWHEKNALGSAPIGLPAAVENIKAIQVGPSNPVLVLNQNSRCSSRVITTAAKGIMIKFGTTTDAATSTQPILWGYEGHLQAASTTVAYDAGVYGCDYLFVWGFDASTTITVSEFR